MTIELSRRLFLIGSVAAVSAAAANIPAMGITEKVVALPAQRAFLKRAIWEIEIIASKEGGGRVEILAPSSDRPVLQYFLSAYSYFRWKPHPDGGEIIIMGPDAVTQIRCTGGIDAVSFICEDMYEGEAMPIVVQEKHHFFPDRSTIETTVLDVCDVERWEKIAMWRRLPP